MILWVIGMVVIVVVLLIYYMTRYQHSVLFKPSREDTNIKVGNPRNLYITNTFSKRGGGIHVVEMLDGYMNNKNRNYIHAWYYDDFPGKKTVLFCHGNSGNITHRSYIINACRKLKLNLLVFDYRGYGKSSLTPTKERIRQDGETAYLFLRQHCEPNDIVIWGESLGGHVATWVASKYECRSLILLSTFSSIDDVFIYQHELNLLSKPLRLVAPLVTDILDTKKYIKDVKAPIMIFHSPDDEIIPCQCARDLYMNISHENKQLVWISGLHASPNITDQQLSKLLMFADIPLQKYKNNFKVQEMLDEIDYIVKKYLTDDT